MKPPLKHASTRAIELALLLDQEFGERAAIHLVAVFFRVCLMNDEQRGVPMTQIMRTLGMPSSSTTRNIQALGSKPPVGSAPGTKPGLGLVDVLDDPRDARAKLVFITPRGRRLWERVTNILQ